MSVSQTRPAAPPVTELSTAELVQRVSEQATRLVHDEIALARAELADKARHAGVGIGLFGGGAVLIVYAVGALVATAALALALVLPGWLAALIVAVALLLLAGLLALIGRREVQRATPPAPRDAVSNVRADVAAVTAAVRERRAHE
jgi:hypothetical protein